MSDHVVQVDGLKWRKDGSRWQYYQNQLRRWCDAPAAFSPFLDRIAEIEKASKGARTELIERLEEATDSVWGRMDVIKKVLADLRGNSK